MPTDLDALPSALPEAWTALKGILDFTDAQLRSEIDRIRQTHAWALVQDDNLWGDLVLWQRLEGAQSLDGRPLLLFLAETTLPLPEDNLLAAAADAGLHMLTLRIEGSEVNMSLAAEIRRLAGHGIATQIIASGDAKAFAPLRHLPTPRIVPADPRSERSEWRALNAPDLYAIRLNALITALRLPSSAARRADALSRGSDARSPAMLTRLGEAECRIVDIVMARNAVDDGLAATASFYLDLRLNDLMAWGDVIAPPPVRLVRRGADGLTLETLAGPEPGCMPLTYGRFWFHWSMRRPDWLAIAARGTDSKIVGLALLSEPITVDGGLGRRLLSLSVDSAHRRRGIAKSLLALSAEAAGESGTPTLFTTYSHHMGSRTHFERTLAACGWTSPEPMEYMIVGQAKWVRAAEREWAPVLARAARQGFSMSAWTDVSDADRVEIDAAIRSGEAPAEWHPDLFLKDGNEAFSLLLRYREKIVGWIIGERDGDLCVHYRRGCLFPPYRKYGFLIVGLYEACRRQAALLGEDSVCVNWASAGSDMARFMETRLRPLLDGTFLHPPQLAKTRFERPGGYLEIRYLARRQAG
ncbi:GNAT family N-acetyltransferase (plasmid) [Ensifer sp. PDNC004]|uniref:GNAT family N-acetyltransferase n=1 Tax=Ensifer sp. PDNC004 TaxID=2811423 RepID=UPI001964453B|nr:GNAT family N-acetyltransferase [Ensifer sp. PDNC004]QRY70608.1 GNAT family N-acetyltransferase [Ensifer sp. PDNC004]